MIGHERDSDGAFDIIKCLLIDIGLADDGKHTVKDAVQLLFASVDGLYFTLITLHGLNLKALIHDIYCWLWVFANQADNLECLSGLL